jgi:hypothetical protein
MSRLPRFLNSLLTDGGDVSFTRRPRFVQQENSWYSFLLEAESNPGPGLKGFGKLKNQVTSWGIEPAAFLFVAQHLNQLRYSVPPPQLFRINIINFYTCIYSHESNGVL